jgi:preprotein translocase subunit SecY
MDSIKLNASVMPILLKQLCLYLLLAGLSKSDASQSIVGAFSNISGLV